MTVLSAPTLPRSSAVLALALFLVASASGCFSGGGSDGQNLSPADLAGKAYAEGDATIAPLGKRRTPTAGKVIGLYGRLAHVEFQSGQQHWVNVKELEPEGRVLKTGIGDGCSVENTAIVKAPWGKRKKLYKGVVDVVHGKFAHVRFNDGDQGWALCAEIVAEGGTQPVAAGGGDPVAKKEPTKAKPAASNGDVCAFNPSRGKYVLCQTFSGGRCRSGARMCKPADKCVFSQKEGKYVKCSNFSQGRCRSGKRACKPRSKCVFRPEKGKHVVCSSFSSGKCKAGTRSCQP